MRTVTIPARTETRYEFGELSGKAQQVALDSWAASQAAGFWDFGGPNEDELYSSVAGALGFTVKHWAISGFGSQGDGASFVGTWDASKAVNAVEAMREVLTTEEAEKLAVEAAELAKGAVGTFTIAHNGARYCHEYTMTVEQDDWNEGDTDRTDEVRELARNLARWAYRTVEREYDYQTGQRALLDAQGEGLIEFREDGKPVWL